MPPDDNVESALIWYKGTERENYKHWVESLEKFLEGYSDTCNCLVILLLTALFIHSLQKAWSDAWSRSKYL